MQEPRSNSTLELVVNEQQLQNMSQIDVSVASYTMIMVDNEPLT